MKIEINFPFNSYTKGELIEFCFGKHADVDTALPLNTCHKIQGFHNDKSAHHWYVMDYTKNKIGGRLVNLKEKFFEKIAKLYLEQIPKTFDEYKNSNLPVIPFRFTLHHDKGTSNILVYSSDESSARKLIMEAENCPDCAIQRKGV